MIRLDLFDDKVVVGAETVVRNDVADLESLIFSVYDPARVGTLWQDSLEPGWRIP